MPRFIVVLSIVLVGVLVHPRGGSAHELSGGIKVGFSSARVPGIQEAVGPVEDGDRFDTAVRNRTLALLAGFRF